MSKCKMLRKRDWWACWGSPHSYNKESFEKEYKIGYYINKVFYYEQTCKEDELEKINEIT